MKTGYHKLEAGFAAVLALAGVIFLWVPSSPMPMSPIRVAWLAGVILLGQGLLRDVVLLTRYRHLLGKGEPARGWYICIESTLGVGLLVLALLFWWLKVPVAFQAHPAAVLFAAAVWWLLGYAMRDWVLELRRDPNHLNLVVGSKL